MQELEPEVFRIDQFKRLKQQRFGVDKSKQSMRIEK